MCGIFGTVARPGVAITARELERVTRLLLRLSQSRGQEASGIAFHDTRQITIRKKPLPGNKFVRTAEYRTLFTDLTRHLDDPLVLFGHARLDTNSSKLLEAENSPLECGQIIGVHNGIIVNVDALWQQHPEIQRTKTVDSEVIFALFDHLITSGVPPRRALRRVFSEIKGSASVAAISHQHPVMALASNTGSLYYARFAAGVFVFASEAYILGRVIKKARLGQRFGEYEQRQIKPGEGCILDVSRFELEHYRFGDG